MTLIKFAYVGEFTSRRRRVGVGEFARRRVDRIPYFLFIMLVLLIVNGGSWIIERSIFVRSALVSAHGVKNEVYTCVLRIGLMDQ